MRFSRRAFKASYRRAAAHQPFLLIPFIDASSPRSRGNAMRRVVAICCSGCSHKTPAIRLATAIQSSSSTSTATMRQHSEVYMRFHEACSCCGSAHDSHDRVAQAPMVGPKQFRPKKRWKKLLALNLARASAAKGEPRFLSPLTLRSGRRPRLEGRGDSANLGRPRPSRRSIRSLSSVARFHCIRFANRSACNGTSGFLSLRMRASFSASWPGLTRPSRRQ